MMKDFSFHGINTKGKIVNVYDGDTFRIVFRYKKEYIKVKCRGYGYDCPEMKVSKENLFREEEIKKAKQARNRVIQLLTNCPIQLDDNPTKKELQKLLDKNTHIIPVSFLHNDKYGRPLVNIPLQKNDLATILIKEGLAKPYYGGKKE